MRTAGRNRDTARGDLEAPSPLFSTLRPTLILRGKVAVNQSLKLLLLGLTPFVGGLRLMLQYLQYFSRSQCYTVRFCSVCGAL